VKKEWIENLVVSQTMGIVMDGSLMAKLTDRLLEMQGEDDCIAVMKFSNIGSVFQKHVKTGILEHCAFASFNSTSVDDTRQRETSF
jgi:hypothetical protein